MLLRFTIINVMFTQSPPLPMGNPRSSHQDAIASVVAKALHRYACLTAQGISGAPPNPASAIKIYNRAIVAGYVPSMYSLATMYEQGAGTEKKPDIAVKLYMRAVALGHIP
eukprot:gb/GEZJ01010625.1/.p1 GENE.gb/GEZJ01010625.1/~~gb/GEZJ01010625.1/.p1  ORF type:complete len:111 (+),score=7.03 gb/GEZJ01010625.1/:220-552(+)